MYIFPLLKVVKGQEKDYRGHRFDDQSLKPSKKVCQVNDGVRNVHVTPIVVLSTSVLSPKKHVHHQDVHSNNEFPQSRNTPGTQQTILSLSEVMQRGSFRGKQYELPHKANVIG